MFDLQLAIELRTGNMLMQRTLLELNITNAVRHIYLLWNRCSNLFIKSNAFGFTDSDFAII